MPDVDDRPVSIRRFSKIAPGLPELLSYDRKHLPHDLIAGVSVAAVALPVGVAYAQLAGFPPEVGLYASILPVIVYAFFGTSRQLILGPDAATCALVAAAVGPLAQGDKDTYASLSIALAALAGLFCIIASSLRLGVLADFLSKPILVGFLNGMALSIALGQIGKIFGFSIERSGIVPRLLEFASKLDLTHLPTVAIGLVSFVVLVFSPKLIPRLPAALAAMAVTAVAVRVFSLDTEGVKTIGLVHAGLPSLRVPVFKLDLLPQVCAQAAGLALIAFSSMMLTARSFATKNRYDIDADREFAALGVANIAAAFSQAFAISGADSRTAMNDASGGRTRVAGLISAFTVAVVLLFLTKPLQFVPIAALGAVLVKAAFSLLDLSSIRAFYRTDRRELVLSLIATLGVVTVGAVQAILVAVILALLRFVRLVSRPAVEILGRVPGIPGFHSVDRHAEAQTIPGLMLFRFSAPIVFFNAPFFRRSVLGAIESASPKLHWFVIDMIPVNLIDLTGFHAMQGVNDDLRERGITLVAAGRETEWKHWVEKRKMVFPSRCFPTLGAAVREFSREINVSAG